MTVFATQASESTQQELHTFEECHPRFGFVPAPQVLGPARTGHLASAMYVPGRARVLGRKFRPDVVHIIGEASYLSTFR